MIKLAHLKFFSLTIPHLSWGQVQFMWLIRFLLILSSFVLTIPTAQAKIEIHNGRPFVQLGEFKQNGLQSIKYTDGMRPTFSQRYDSRFDVYSRTSGAKSSVPVAATVSRSVPSTKVAARLFSKLRFLRLSPQALIGGLVLDELLRQHDFQYNEETGQYQYQTEHPYVLSIWHNNEANTVTVLVVGISQSAYERYRRRDIDPYFDTLCNRAWDMEAPKRRYFVDYMERGFKPIGIDKSFGISCQVQKGDDVRHVLSVSVDKNTSFPPLTAERFEEILKPHFEKDAEKIVELAGLPEAEWSQPKVHVLDGTTVNSQPYTDIDGKPKQATWRFYDCDSGTCVEEKIIDRPDLQPDSPEAPRLQDGSGGGSPTGGTTDTPAPEENKPSLCEEYPHIMACDTQPDASDVELEIPEEIVKLDFQPENRFATDGQCPAPVSFDITVMSSSKTFFWDFERACNVASRMKYLIIALAWVVAAFFCIRTVSREV